MCTLQSFVFSQLFSLPHLICCCCCSICCICALVSWDDTDPFSILDSDRNRNRCVCVFVSETRCSLIIIFFFLHGFRFFEPPRGVYFLSFFRENDSGDVLLLLLSLSLSLLLSYCTFQMTFSSCCCWLFVKSFHFRCSASPLRFSVLGRNLPETSRQQKRKQNMRERE